MAIEENERVVLVCSCNGRGIATALKDSVEAARKYINDLPQHRDHIVTVSQGHPLMPGYDVILDRHPEGFVLYDAITADDWSAVADYVRARG